MMVKKMYTTRSTNILRKKRERDRQTDRQTERNREADLTLSTDKLKTGKALPFG